MKRSTGIISFYIIIGLAFVSTNASASGVPIRRPSDNGTYDTAQYWNLVASMAPITLTS